MTGRLRLLALVLTACLPFVVVVRPLRGNETTSGTTVTTAVQLTRALRAGGYVIFFRHAATDPNQADTDRANLARCESQRNLSEEGRQMARDIGAAFKTLGIRVGKVIASPYCRTLETGELAFGRVEKADALYFALGADRDERARQSAELRRMLATPPAAGTNTVLVSHNGNLKEATGLWPKREGDAFVFRPRPGGTFVCVGMVAAAEWEQWARATGTAQRAATCS